MQIYPYGDAMKWNQAIVQDTVTPRSKCRLVIIGENKDGQPFCMEEAFLIQRVGPNEFVVSLEYQGINPLEKLDHVSFIECSFRDRGNHYYAFTQLTQLEIKKNCCLLSLTVPEEIVIHQNRKYTRMNMPARIPITARIIGIREQIIHQGSVFYGQLLDISGGGLSFITVYRLFYPLFLELSFVLPDHPERFAICGEIVRVSNFSNDSYRIAVEFSKMPEDVLRLIDNYCSGLA
jgi:c-di-GMP-binding flagellar brake protein YcgR